MSIQEQLPKSRITLTYRTTINGEQETVNLPLRLLMLGDFSLGSSEDRKVDLEARKLRSVNGRNLDDLMADMKMSLRFQVPNRINPDVEADLDVELPVTKMKSFHPDEIVNHVPKLKALRLLKKLLLEMQSSIDNQKALRNLVYQLFSDKDALKAVLAELKDYESLRLPAKSAAPASDPQGAPAASGAADATARAPAPATVTVNS
ncbi:type VI secretion system contractile sheath small subunit [Myxococcus sp. K15C18031901]|uniref:type VI secretion system contractile sheath small subunit n=1 Tax=Myxococcus dinghuensis TaxID=2906761 RepID=UPI0020A76B41|nr:type VI secretion system contractile sheath small subunit [Myxococcus dinghuensis]MCP3101827.1 type VI secretion system contractile sheath small subunit [Myxococcus dinghuensis]